MLENPHSVSLFRQAVYFKSYDPVPCTQYIAHNFRDLVGNILKTNYGVHYVQVTVYRDKLSIKQPTRCIIYAKFILS